MTLQSTRPPLIQRAGAIARALVVDGAIVGGAFTIFVGVDMIHRPSALIFSGLTFITFGLLAAVRRT